MKKYLYKISILFLLSLFNFFTNCMPREKKSWDEKVYLRNKKYLNVHYNYSRNKILFSFPHAIVIGGGDPEFIVTIKLKNKNIIWEYPYRPIIIEINEEEIYIVAYDYLSNKKQFRFYKYNKKWLEIDKRNFPKKLAIQNTWIHYDYEKKLNIYDSMFQSSLTAVLWRYLITDDIDNENFFEDVPVEILLKYKTKYIDPNK